MLLPVQSGQTACPSADLPRTGGGAGANSGEAKAHRSEITQERDAQSAKETTGKFSKSTRLPIFNNYSNDGGFIIVLTL